MNFIEAIYQQIDFIRNDVLSGSSTIALNALDVVTAAIDVQDRNDPAFPLKVASLLKESKPSVAAITVVCDYALKDFYKSKNIENKYFSIDVRKKLLRASEETLKLSYSRLINPENKVIKIATCSFSSNVMRFLKLADKRGYKLHVYIIDSIWNKRNYASLLAYELNNTAILSKIISLDEFADVRNELDYCLIGADGFDENKNVVNGIPSLNFAMLSKDYVPFYVIAESFKRVEYPVSDDGFEFIPAQFITEILTDSEYW
jgi:translation initiation factor 2B subunit (eIF-2B alpha/beta/delta family)